MQRAAAPLAFFAALAMVPVHCAAADGAAVEVGTRIEDDATTTLVHETLIAASVPQVWAAISSAEGWMKWAVPLARFVPGEPDVLETSYDPEASLGSPQTIRHRFLTRVPGRILAFRTIKTPQGFPFGAEYQAVTNVFELAPEGNSTRLRLTSVGYPDSEAGRTLVEFFRQGNAETLRELQALFEVEQR